MAKQFIKPAQFRASATDQDYADLLEYLTSQDSKVWDEESCPYGFSRASARNLLKEKGLIKDQDPEIKLQVDPDNINAKQYTIYCRPETWERIQKVYSGYGAMNKKNVMDAFLNFALDNLNL